MEGIYSKTKQLVWSCFDFFSISCLKDEIDEIYISSVFIVKKK